MPGGLVIRDAVPDDRAAVLTFWPHPDRFDRRLILSRAGEEVLLVADLPDPGAGAAGIVSIRWSGGCDDPVRPLLYALEVRPDRRGRGIGTGLIRHVASLVAARGRTEITLEVEVGNAGAIRLYHRLGFATIGPHQHVWHAGTISGTAETLIMHGRTAHLMS
ncbi:GNAT family N-acetyltransferase [Actinoplanes couchii]|uniref:N-acetyltransferase domain-containing protein n=1 Tax=Actinoplanes couchii TaxID=403638 RepID=A0ABQ3X4C7_9ACTN|nr:GNAT family N-acetyltransferase [Actinoplanes couchii]MDR6326398.1 ribosomal protein S18 acetylase RimI-like enzyme [Actinoplanes couchii]GID53250.1 hypothetical protein Aco03nite_016540 [Actinoplanes couchii]